MRATYVGHHHQVREGRRQQQEEADAGSCRSNRQIGQNIMGADYNAVRAGTNRQRVNHGGCLKMHLLECSCLDTGALAVAFWQSSCELCHTFAILALLQPHF